MTQTNNQDPLHKPGMPKSEQDLEQKRKKQHESNELDQDLDDGTNDDRPVSKDDPRAIKEPARPPRAPRP